MTDNKSKEYKYKKAVDANLDYFLEHAEEMIADTEHVLDPICMDLIEQQAHDRKDYLGISRIIRSWRKAHVHHNMMFGRGKFYLAPGETEPQASYRIVHDYCEATGHWDFFVWEDIPEDQRGWYIKE